MWQIQEAKQRFSEVVDKATRDGPQIVTRRGREVAVIVSIEEFRKLSASRKDIKQLLLGEGPDFSQLDLKRSGELPREVEL